MNAESKIARFELPSGWQDQTTYTFAGPPLADMPHTVVLTIDQQRGIDNITEFARETTDVIKQQLQGIEVLKDEETTSNADTPVWEFVYKWMPSEQEIIFLRYIFVIRGGIAYNFVGRFTKKTLKTVGVQMYDLVEAVLPGTFE